MPGSRLLSFRYRLGVGSRFQRSMARMPCQDLHFWARDMDIELLTLPNLGVESLEAELGVSNPTSFNKPLQHYSSPGRGRAVSGLCTALGPVGLGIGPGEYGLQSQFGVKGYTVAFLELGSLCFGSWHGALSNSQGTRPHKGAACVCLAP